MRPRASRLVAALVILTGAAVPHAQAREVPPILGNAQRLSDGHYRIALADGTRLMTHGPDPAPSRGGGLGIGDPERAPLCASDYYQHVLYGRPTGSPDRLAAVKSTLQASMRRINALLNDEALSSGDKTADYKVLCDPTGSIRVDSFVSPSADFSAIVDAARAAGFSASNADYSIFFDGQPDDVCGIGSVSGDERLLESNLNNGGGDYAVSYSNCWTNETPMHENGHNQGAVQYNAAYSTGTGWHCIDENDVMCYSPDGGDRNQGGTIDRCTDRLHFDCGNDTYFDAAPEQDDYLATHWNIGSTLNRFIVFQPVKRPPVPAFDIACDEFACSFTDLSADEGSIASWRWDFGDETTSSVRHPSHVYAGQGSYIVSLTVTDDDDMSATASQILAVPNEGDPDPSTPNLSNGIRRLGTSGPNGSWSYYKIHVPWGREVLNVDLDGRACIPQTGVIPNPLGAPIPDGTVCNPDIDLYVRHGQRPNRTSYVCRPHQVTNDEHCTIARPQSGYWYIGINTAFATPSVMDIDPSRSGYTILATY